jgi:hypothetical protein
MTVELHSLALEHLESKFNILLKLNDRQFDLDWNSLIKKLNQIKLDQFLPNDRILICHMDTDYYDPLLPVGTVVNNLIRCFQSVDIPLYLLLFVTNHYGISKEFDLLLANHHPNDRPTIVETLLSDKLLQSPNKANMLLEVEKIEKAGLCMVGMTRSHRIALFNFLKNNNLLGNVAVSANFKKTNDLINTVSTN